MEIKNKQTCNASLIDYSESKALQELLQCIDDALNVQLSRFEHDDWSTDQFTININGKSIAFYLGGPQADALFAFISHIASENGYAVDLEKNTVEE